MNLKIKNSAILVATHKSYEFPSDKGYLPIEVGSALRKQRLPIQGDDSGENISELNPYFCELTGLYWLWRNVDAQYYGLVHYRRHFKPIEHRDSLKIKTKQIARSSDLVAQLNDYRLVLPKKRNYYVESVQKHYQNAHQRNDLKALTNLISRKYPEYVQTWHTFLAGRQLSLFNMFVMKKEDFQAYCQWLFPLLFELEEKIPYKAYGPYQRRVFGFLAERLLNLWVLKNIPHEKVLYLPVINIEGENLFLKAASLLTRKYFSIKKK